MGQVTRRSAAGARRIGARRAFHGQAGVTIIEVLIAAVVVGIGAVGAAVMFASGQAFVSAEGDNRVALALAQQKIEQIRSRGHAGLRAVCPIPTPTPDCPGGQTEDVPGSGSPPAGTPLPWCVTGEPCYRRTTEVFCVNRDNYAGGSEACIYVGASASAFLITVAVVPLNDPKTRTVTLPSVLAPR